MDILNGAIESLINSSNKEDWTPVALNVADATVTISKQQVGHGRHRQTAASSFPAVLTLFPLMFILKFLCVVCTLSLTLISTHLRVSRTKRRCWWSVAFVSCRLWVSAAMCTRSPSSWTSADIVSTVTSSGANPTLVTCPRLYKQPAWWVGTQRQKAAEIAGFLWYVSYLPFIPNKRPSPKSKILSEPKKN